MLHRKLVSDAGERGPSEHLIASAPPRLRTPVSHLKAHDHPVYRTPRRAPHATPRHAPHASHVRAALTFPHRSLTVLVGMHRVTITVTVTVTATAIAAPTATAAWLPGGAIQRRRQVL